MMDGEDGGCLFFCYAIVVCCFYCVMSKNYEGIRIIGCYYYYYYSTGMYLLSRRTATLATSVIVSTAT